MTRRPTYHSPEKARSLCCKWYKPRQSWYYYLQENKTRKLSIIQRTKYIPLYSKLKVVCGIQSPVKFPPKFSASIMKTDFFKVWKANNKGFLSDLAWENSRHFATPLQVSKWNDVWETSTEIPYWWRATIQIWVALVVPFEKLASTD